MRFVVPCVLSGLVVWGVACGKEDLATIQNKAPVADAGVGGTVNKGQPVTFDGSTSSDEDGEIVSYVWDFGDGNTREGALITYIYNGAGTFTVTLTVTDNDGDTGTAELQMVVLANEAPNTLIVAPATANVNESVQFNGATSLDPDGSIVSWTWDFGDNNTGTGALVSNMFLTAGTYTVRLTCTDDKGAVGEALHVIEITAGPAGFSGTWNWFLVDPNQRTLPGFCGTFEDSTLIINAQAPSITITEQAGGVTATYTGTLIEDAFDAVYGGAFGMPQRITGTFDSATTFTGTYSIDLSALGESCAVRAVTGIKVN